MKSLLETLRLALWLLAGVLAVVVSVTWREASRWPEPLPPTKVYCQHTHSWR